MYKHRSFIKKHAGQQNKTNLRMPIRARIEVCRFCNLKCPSCPIGRDKIRDKKIMSFEDFKFIIDKIKISVEELSLFNYGEPLLNPSIVKMIKYAKKNGMKIINLHSNGLLLEKRLAEKLVKSGIDYISFSIDGASKETYQKYRIGGDLNTVVKNVSYFIDLKKRLKSKKPVIGIQFIVMKHNQYEIKKFIKIWKDIGADEVIVKTFNAYMSGYEDRKSNLKYLPKNSNYTRYKTFEAKEISDIYKSDHCMWAWENLVINSNGDIALCCHDFNADTGLGNILKDNNWWDNENRRKLQARIKNKKNALCKHCNIGMLYLKIDKNRKKRNINEVSTDSIKR